MRLRETTLWARTAGRIEVDRSVQELARSTIILLIAIAIAYPQQAISIIPNHDLSLLISIVVLQSAIGYFFQIRPFYRRSLALSAAGAERRATQEREGRRQEFDARLHRALEMADHEPEALGVVARALALASAENPSELLLADSSQAHLARVAHHPADGDPGCGVASPAGCPAVTRGQTSLFASGDELDSCPHLRDRVGGDRSAACVPVTILGSTVGVLHATSEPGQFPNADVVARLETVATQAGARIGMIRALARSQVQASTDPLTGLLNRRSLEEQLRPILDGGRQYTLLMADLDHFKLLNDTHGHDAGDRALRLFAGVVKRSLRPGDLACRQGGEEFVLVLPDCDSFEAQQVALRIRESLSLALVSGSTPGFTASFGVADSLSHGTEYDTLLTIADIALLDAKRAGRDRVMVAAS